MKRRKRDIAVFVLVIFLMGSLLGRQVVLWMGHHLTELDERIAKQEELLELANKEIQANSAYAVQWEEVSGFLNEPSEERKTNFTEYLQGLAARREFIFTDLGPGDARAIEENPQFQVLEYELSFAVKLDKLVDFMVDLDASEELMSIEKMTVTAKLITAYSGWSDRTFGTDSLNILSVKMVIATVAAGPESSEEIH